MNKIPVGVLGATGMVGQKLVELLQHHPWFEITALAASSRSVGKSYHELIRTTSSSLLPSIAQMKLTACEPFIPCSLVFSALDSDVAGPIEETFAYAGYQVVSNARNHRMVPHVPLLVPEVNPDHLQLLKKQPFGQGLLITNPNCVAIPLSLALKPLYDLFGVEAVHIVTCQAVSGAGYPGVASLDILDNIIPFIEGEEDKVETEPLKILGQYHEGRIIPAPIQISAHCNRVPVSDGHFACVSVKLKQKVSKEEMIKAWEAFADSPQQLKLPTAPVRPLIYLEGERHPQPKLHRHLDQGMAVILGRFRPCSLFDWKFSLLSHNIMRGAAGAALLNAELLVVSRKALMPIVDDMHVTR